MIFGENYQCDLSDAVLCRLAAGGDRVAEEALVTRYARLVRICARPFFLTGGDSEDLIQEGMVGLLAAVREYAPHRQTSFRTFAETCIRNRILSAIKTASREKHLPLNSRIPFDAHLSQGTTDHYFCGGAELVHSDPEALLLHREDARERLYALKGKLSDFEMRVLALYLDGLSYDEIARQLARPPKSVDNAVQRIRRKIARHLFSGDFSGS